MKIRRLATKNDYVLGDLELDFTDEKGDVVNTIILAGENGVGKTRILEIIHNFGSQTLRGYLSQFENSIYEFEIELSEDEFNSIKNEKNFGQINLIENKFIVYLDTSSTENYCKIKYNNGTDHIYSTNYLFVLSEGKKYFQTTYSTTQINFNVNKISSVTAKEIDEQLKDSLKQTENISTEIAQLLIDIDASDNSDLAKWVDENPGLVPPQAVKKIRTNRFKNAFEFMFPCKKFNEIKNVDGSKEILFVENQKKMTINELSSGEKQIVFRGGFLLKNQNSNKGIILIDEPEISLHPTWQMKILEFFKINQIILTTHSPFILHNESRANDKVITLKKDYSENICVSDEKKFFNWTNEEIIKEAFNIDYFLDQLPNNKKPLIITEGKTDWKHFKTALEFFKSKDLFLDLDIDFLEYTDSNDKSKDAPSIKLNMSVSELNTILLSLSKFSQNNKIIGIFDSDHSIGKKYLTSQHLGNNVFAFCINDPSHRKKNTEGISVELLYYDSDLLQTSPCERRLYLSNEFSKKGRFLKDTDICYENSSKISKHLEETTQKIIDTDVSNSKDQSLALSKSDFANYIYKKTPPFDNINFEGFKDLFIQLRNIINNN
ncbi:MAG: ATP-binding protein [Cetobacterium sp.]|uniref:AAA family ATPase n=1 Tax=Cetobacterium sp. TaxID=2071632 RepID=UPI002FCBD776